MSGASVANGIWKPDRPLQVFVLLVASVVIVESPLGEATVLLLCPVCVLMGCGPTVGASTLASVEVLNNHYFTLCMMLAVDPSWCFSRGEFVVWARAFLLNAVAAYCAGHLSLMIVRWCLWRPGVPRRSHFSSMDILVGLCLVAATLLTSYGLTHTPQAVTISREYWRLRSLPADDLVRIAADDTQAEQKRVEALLVLPDVSDPSNRNRVFAVVEEIVEGTPADSRLSRAGRIARSTAGTQASPGAVTSPPWPWTKNAFEESAYFGRLRSVGK